MEIRPVTLVGRGIILEPLSIEHLDQLCAVGLDPALWQLTTSSVASRDEMRAYIEAALQLQADGTALPFAQWKEYRGRRSAAPGSETSTEATNDLRSDGHGSVVNGNEPVPTLRQSTSC